MFAKLNVERLKANEKRPIVLNISVIFPWNFIKPKKIFFCIINILATSIRQKFEERA